MKVHVVVGIQAGVLEHVSGSDDAEEAQGKFNELRREYGIMPGHEEESSHSVHLEEIEIKEKKQ